jgi:hypothetical protein
VSFVLGFCSAGGLEPLYLFTFAICILNDGY